MIHRDSLHGSAAAAGLVEDGHSPAATVLQVALALPLPSPFDYLPPAGQTINRHWIGCRVEVPFGPRRLIGMVVGVSARPPGDRRLRQALRRIDQQPLLPDELWHTLHWMADYYHAPWGEVLALAQPAGLRQGDTPESPGRWVWRRCDNADHHAVQRLRRGALPEQLWQRLEAVELDEDELDTRLEGWRGAARRLQALGLVERLRRAASSLPPPQASAGFTLNDEQQAAVDAVRARLPGAANAGFQTFLLDGITGSGKTEVYLELLAEVLASGRQAVVLVPEIALTPQTVRRFRRRLGEAVLVWHSGLAEGERRKTWARLAAAEPLVLVGTRSAVLLPLPGAALIVIDEEHDGSYKQQDGVRYSARDLALVRAQALGLPVLLGSATPCLETLAQAQRGRYQTLRLRTRAGGARPPQVEVLDVRKQTLQEGLAAPALAAIRRTLEGGGQVLVFRNRRGYAPALLCHDCGFVAQCARCDRPMTLHRAPPRLECHHCGAQARLPAACPDCQGLALQPQGIGTERLQDSLTQMFPQYPVLRIDRDSTRGKDAVERLLSESATRPSILVGTQMLAKGHDLPLLQLVVVLGVDDGLHSIDFRAPERLAQLLIQVAGRAGRAQRPGHVLLQTHHPQHPFLTGLLSGGYRQFAEQALAERQALGLPPYAHLALLRAEAQSPSAWREFLQQARDQAAAWLGQQVDASAILPAPMPKRAGYSRGQLLLSAAQRPALQALLKRWVPTLYDLPGVRKVRWSLDVDPSELG
ncbi:primosomal protein N' [Pseudomarimonas arenosa]|uniref:Replication restart protein PriA n=1 Tax=Pseudomarimonas arenosa TaxID=2774145 RepID=A0AAW3ZTN0_9GAMM|nr:primosomal protein N' [Pseudomarimonas arenosa]MBD8527471.1 primosomal protein N' [Pseudomarimonas arenosa]